MPAKPRKVKLKLSGTVQATRLNEAAPIDRNDASLEDNDQDHDLQIPKRSKQRTVVLDDSDEDAQRMPSQPRRAPQKPATKRKRKAESDEEARLISRMSTFTIHRRTLLQNEDCAVH